MIRRLFFFLFLMTINVSMAPGDLLSADPSIGSDPDGLFGDPDDEFKPVDYGLIDDHSTGGTTSGRSRQEREARPDPSKDFLLKYWVRVLTDQFEN